MKAKKITALVVAMVMLLSLTSAFAGAADKKYTVSEPDAQGIVYVTQEGGETLGYNVNSGVKLIEDDGFAFKDLNKNGKLDTYEDWRLDVDTRAEALANLMANDGRGGIEAISGLMLYSSHTAVNSTAIAPATMTALTDEHLRHVLVTNIASPAVAAEWANNVQAYAESVEYGIPANNSSDPRHSVSSSNVEYEIGSTGALSQWPSSIGLAATFDTDIAKESGKIVSSEYRALGIATSLGPQIDLSGDPRWTRVNGTWGEDTYLSIEMTKAFVDGNQTTYDADGNPIGWGAESINAMVKHWPGGGAGEGGRDAHYNYGKFSVFPADNLAGAMAVFTEGAFKLEDGTGSAAAVMPYYTISYDQDPTGGNVGNSYSRYFITDQLRGVYDFKGVACTDWNIVYDVGSPYSFGGMCWGMENVDITDRFVRLIATGIDQFGGVNAIANIMFAYDKSVEDNGLNVTNQMWANSAKRLLNNIFQTGLFENPYLDIEASAAKVGNTEYMEKGYDAQLKSVVMVKNSGGIISADGLGGKVYAANANNLNDASAAALFQSYFGDNYTDDVSQAKAMFIVINAPSGGGYDRNDFNAGGNGYVPMTLQYSPYTAVNARVHSIASNPNVYWEQYGYDVENRSYRDKSYSNNSLISALDNYNTLTAQAKEAGIPVITYVRASNPMVFSEIEPAADAILIGYAISTQAALDIATGKVEPRAMLPMQQPADMDAVEEQFEDAGHDMRCYVDADGNTYDFAFGLNWSGIIGVDTPDARYDKYVLSNDATEAAVKGGITTGKCGEGETASFDVTYEGKITATAIRVQLNTELKMLNVTSDYECEFNPANGKVIVWNVDGFNKGDVLFNVTYDLNVNPMLADGQHYVTIKTIEAVDENDEQFNLLGIPGTIFIDNDYPLGDVNKDGSVTNADLIMIARYLVELEKFDAKQMILADYNEDGDINNIDLVLIARAIVEA